MKYKYLIVDDEPLARKLIAMHCSKMEGLENAGEFCDAIEAGNFLRTNPTDLIFLDIQMPEITGLQFVRTLKSPPAIILTTAFRDFAPEAFDLDVVDYLLKPISFERFVKSVNKFFDKMARSENKMASPEPTSEFIYIKSDRKIHKIALSDVLYLESLDDYVKIFLRDKILVTRENITSLDQRLPREKFVRIHRSFIVSVRSVNTVSTEGVELGSKRLPFGRAFKQMALAALGVNEKGASSW